MNNSRSIVKSLYTEKVNRILLKSTAQCFSLSLLAFLVFLYLLQSQLFGEWGKIAQHVGENSLPESLFHPPKKRIYHIFFIANYLE